MMAPSNPPKRAPKDVPVEAAFYLDKAADELAALAKDEGLHLKPYEDHAPGRNWWVHGLYGKTREREICIQVVTDERMAATFAADLKAYLTHCLPDGRCEWVLIETRRVEDMASLVTAAAELTDVLRRLCVWGMPHPTDPDPKN